MEYTVTILSRTKHDVRVRTTKEGREDTFTVPIDVVRATFASQGIVKLPANNIPIRITRKG